MASQELPTQFVRHYLRRDDGVLHTVVAIATLPIILPDGGVLALEDDIDPERGIEFRIPKEVLALLPDKEDCGPSEVREAMRFLTDEWLCDVLADYPTKCVAIAGALTIIERSLLADRPVFFITSGRRGAGKTTLIIMLIMAVTGIRPAASAWSANEEERRKALLSYLMYGVPYIAWDNIPRGAQITCPHIERSCTAESYARQIPSLLGSSIPNAMTVVRASPRSGQPGLRPRAGLVQSPRNAEAGTLPRAIELLGRQRVSLASGWAQRSAPRCATTAFTTSKHVRRKSVTS